MIALLIIIGITLGSATFGMLCVRLGLTENRYKAETYFLMGIVGLLLGRAGYLVFA